MATSTSAQASGPERVTPADAREVTARQRWMGVLARCPEDRLAALLDETREAPGVVLLRGPEQGLVMARGRASASGAPFNLGEITVTRCSVRLASGIVGHAYVAGRSGRKARLAAIADALLQDPAHRVRIESAVIEPLEADERSRRERRACESAATRVEFFTMVRSEHGA